MGDNAQILQGHVMDVLKTLPDESVQMCITSPPYWGLRDYGTEPQEWGGDPSCDHDWNERRWYAGQSAAGTSGEAFSVGGEANAARLKLARWRSDATCRCGAWSGSLGLEPTPELYVAHLVEIFREVRRVLRKDGTLWLVLGDSYAASPKGNLNGQDKSGLTSTSTQEHSPAGVRKLAAGLKPKDLVGIPWRVAFALQSDGWYLRSDIIWAKPNPMPESVTDRPTKAHEYLFLLAKSGRYFYDAAEIAEPFAEVSIQRMRQDGVGQWQFGGDKQNSPEFPHADAGGNSNKHWKIYTGLAQKDRAGQLGNRNKRTVWTIPTSPFPEAHFAVFPEALVLPCILAGCPAGGTVLDPFCGSGTTGIVAVANGRKFLGIELNPKYVEMAEQRIQREVGLLS